LFNHPKKLHISAANEEVVRQTEKRNEQTHPSSGELPIPDYTQSDYMRVQAVPPSPAHFPIFSRSKMRTILKKQFEDDWEGTIENHLFIYEKNLREYPGEVMVVPDTIPCSNITELELLLMMEKFDHFTEESPTRKVPGFRFRQAASKRWRSLCSACSAKCTPDTHFTRMFALLIEKKVEKEC
jgi:hypothetical protein